MKATIVALIVGAALTGVASPGRAQEARDLTSLTPEELARVPAETVPDASKYLRKIADAPASVSIVTAEEIRLYGYRTLADVLNSVRGMSISYDRNYTYLGFRGLSRPGDLNTRVLILIDGHRLNDNVFDSALIGDEFPLDLESVARVEIIRGPGAAMYGTGAFSAVISVITKRALTAPRLEAAASLGTLDTRRLRAAWGHTARSGASVFVSGSTGAASGNEHLYFPAFDAAETNNGVADHADAQSASRLAMNLDAGHFSLQSVYSRRLKHVPTASFGTLFNDSRTRTFDERGYIDLQYGREIGQRSDVIAHAYWDHYQYDGWYTFGNEDRAPTVNRDYVHGSWAGGEFTVAHRVSTAHRLTAGVEYRHSLDQDQTNYDEPPSGMVYFDDDRRQTSWAANVQDEFTLHPRLQLTGAVRYESVANGSPQLTPKIGVITHLRATTTVKLLYSRAVRSPSAYELFYQSPPNYISNPALSSERIESYEAAIEHDIASWAHVSGSLFANRLNGVIISKADPAGQIQFVNGIDARSRGFEFAWTSRSKRGLQARLSYAGLRDSKVQAGWFGGAPTRLAKFNVGLPLERLGAKMGLSVLVSGTRETHTGEALPAVAVTNWTVIRSLGRSVQIQGAVYNVFNVRYNEPASTDHLQGSIPQDGRQIAVNLLWRLR